MVKLNFNRRNIGFTQLGTVQIEYQDWEGDTLAAELNLEEAANLCDGLQRLFIKAQQSYLKEKGAKRKNKRGAPKNGA